jgi:hypothetical protein
MQWQWNLILRDYNEAKEYIEDIKDICDDFEGLCQRNLAANTGAVPCITKFQYAVGANYLKFKIYINNNIISSHPIFIIHLLLKDFVIINYIEVALNFINIDVTSLCNLNYIF